MPNIRKRGSKYLKTVNSNKVREAKTFLTKSEA